MFGHGARLRRGCHIGPPQLWVWAQVAGEVGVEGGPIELNDP